jgi:hypothetical protein
LRFDTRAKSLFAADRTKLKRQIARVFAQSYVLTQGEVQIRPHRLLAHIARLEPPEETDDMGKSGDSCAAIPLGWAVEDSNL